MIVGITQGTQDAPFPIPIRHQLRGYTFHKARQCECDAATDNPAPFQGVRPGAPEPKNNLPLWASERCACACVSRRRVAREIVDSTEVTCSGRVWAGNDGGSALRAPRVAQFGSCETGLARGRGARASSVNVMCDVGRRCPRIRSSLSYNRAV